MIYLAAPVGSQAEWVLRLRRLALAVLRDAHEAVYDPAVAIVGSAADVAGTVRINQAALERCDAVLALTVGTMVEIRQAVQFAIPVVCVGGVGSLPLMTLGVASFWPSTAGVREAVAFLRETLDRHQPVSPSSVGLE